jgi:hypothetical protein
MTKELFEKIVEDVKGTGKIKEIEIASSEKEEITVSF